MANHFASHMQIAACVDTYLPHDDARLRLAPATVIGVVVGNIVAGHRPGYALAE